jgi:hypothetical protein
LTVIAVAAEAGLTLMLFVTFTWQTIVLPPTLSEPLHWLTEFTTLTELTVFPVQGFSAHVRVYVTVEVFPVGVMLLIMLTLQVTLNGAPPGPAFRSLHWLNETVAAAACSGLATSAVVARTPMAKRIPMPAIIFLSLRPLCGPLARLAFIRTVPSLLRAVAVPHP